MPSRGPGNLISQARSPANLVASKPHWPPAPPMSKPPSIPMSLPAFADSNGPTPHEAEPVPPRTCRHRDAPPCCTPSFSAGPWGPEPWGSGAQSGAARIHRSQPYLWESLPHHPQLAGTDIGRIQRPRMFGSPRLNPCTLGRRQPLIFAGHRIAGGAHGAAMPRKGSLSHDAAPFPMEGEGRRSHGPGTALRLPHAH